MGEIAWIKVVGEGDADEELSAVYDECFNQKTGRVAHIYKVHSLHPQSMLHHAHLFRTLVFGPGPLTRAQREMIATVVSAINACHY